MTNHRTTTKENSFTTRYREKRGIAHNKNIISQHTNLGKSGKNHGMVGETKEAFIGQITRGNHISRRDGPQTEMMHTSNSRNQPEDPTTSRNNSILIPENQTGSPKGLITSTISHTQLTDTTRTPTDSKLDCRPYNHRSKTNSAYSGNHKNGNRINICGLNVCGLNSKLDNGVFKDYLQKFDIFCVTESRTSVGDPINNYTVFNMENKPKKKCQYPGIHGIQVYISDRIASLCSIINDINFACRSVLWINVANNFILGTVYIPCDRSPHYWPEFFEDFEEDISDIKSQYDLPLMIIGDFNSRTGTLNEIMLLDNDDIVLDSSYFKYPDVLNTLKYLNMPIKRSNVDKSTNHNGNNLVDLCKVQELVIVNGRIGADKNIGRTTCDDISTIDYVICTPDFLPYITHFSVNNFDPLYSDKHKPISVNLNLNNSLHVNNNAIKQNNEPDLSADKTYIKCQWDDSKKDDYQKNFDMNKIQNLSLKLSAVNTNDTTLSVIDNLTLDLQNIFTEPAEVTGMYKEVHSSSKPRNVNKNKPWFSALCKNSKDNYKRFKRALPEQHSDTDKSELKHLAKKHKKLLRTEKRKYDKEFNAKLKTLKSTNRGEYWRIINQGKKLSRWVTYHLTL